VDYPEGPPFVDGIQNTASWNGAGENAYPAGTLLSSFDDGANWKSYASDGSTCTFRPSSLPTDLG